MMVSDATSGLYGRGAGRSVASVGLAGIGTPGVAALHRGLEGLPQRAVTGFAIFEFQPHALRDRTSLVHGAALRCLRQINELAIIAEVAREQLRVTIETEAANH